MVKAAWWLHGLVVKHTPISSCPYLCAAACVWLLLGAGCSSTPPAAANPNVDTDSYWDGDGMSGSPSVRISLSRQRAYFYKGGELAGVSRISSGREGRDTVTGNFHIIQKDQEHSSSLFGSYLDAHGAVLQNDVDTSKDAKPKGAVYAGARMPNFMRIVGGTGMHEGYLPGYAASHGCIRMPGFMAEAFFRSVEVGTPVSIEP
ncbi:MAG: hypothetical protein B7Z37_06755 [Verrucomicrobia bacterium 12-59-8]|nr:MAG: hypothetical protein B7Z37_06755 [Verrucomicrobia bacterium 12-59-8]